MRNPLEPLARKLGTQPWVMTLSPGIIWTDQRLHRFFGGRVSLVGIAGLPSLRLTTTGRKSGLPRSTNLLYFPHGEDFVLTGSNWGRPKNPAWTYNLRAEPKATVAIRGRVVAVKARELEGAEYDRMWSELLAFWPGYDMERAAAARPLPVFVLSRR
ncbi:nitroreductase family deazaflavin-dependent oxidoreductase [Amycolatopsis sp. FDAARGOS 1241]|uniref:nitroreductase family deazaflavin-dependent oxidoreductase n=1 Tax=Amycolatopsis sp. FDAARGOS 1241 TaxID=2778070 RepID=UPI001951BFF3|nr:nitroreductase family deazaflavin-dependent oxidoreductase [Amycolatopsis sp. FDAARGOS 1241]QRP49651.1 nitroreductase family deazaflavin-dependent oxidoreductase [Amycolatopsis sp. FDAARGOS 1241]